MTATSHEGTDVSDLEATVTHADENPWRPSLKSPDEDWLLCVQPIGEEPAFMRPEMLVKAEAEDWPYVPLCDEFGDPLTVGAGRVFLLLSELQASPKQPVRMAEREAILLELTEATSGEEFQASPDSLAETSDTSQQIESSEDVPDFQETDESAFQAPTTPTPGRKLRR